MGFLPRHVEALDPAIEVRACFVGQSTVTLEEILTYTGVNRWHLRLERGDLERVPEWIMRWSASVEGGCAELGLPYVDLAGDFEAGMRRAELALLGET